MEAAEQQVQRLIDRRNLMQRRRYAKQRRLLILRYPHIARVLARKPMGERATPA